MTIRWFLIANPEAGNGNFATIWAEIQYQLKINSISYEYALTAYGKHEIELVQQAIQDGFTHIIAVGGDGTLHHVVNGIMTQNYVKTTAITVGVIPVGTGNDWVKTYNIPKKIELAVAKILKNETVAQDIGYLELEDTSAYFNNVAGIGYDGYVVQKLNKLKRFGGIAYLLSGIMGLLFYKKTPFTILVNDETLTTPCLMTLFGICKYSGGGMQLTSYTDSADGLFDITIAKNLTLFDLLINLPKLYNGRIVNHKKVTTYLSKTITVIPKNINNQPFIQADGELIGTGNVTVSIVEKALHFIV